MGLDKQIAAARKARGWSQTELAEEVDVSVEAVSKWEPGIYKPGKEKMLSLEEKLELAAFDGDGNLRNPRLFDEDHMSNRPYLLF